MRATPAAPAEISRWSATAPASNATPAAARAGVVEAPRTYRGTFPPPNFVRGRKKQWTRTHWHTLCVVSPNCFAMGRRQMFRVFLIILAFVFECAYLVHAQTAGAAELNPGDQAKTSDQDCLVCQFGQPDPSYDCATAAHFDVADGRLIFVCLSDADFSGASFRDMDLTGANLAHARLDAADFTGAKLVLANLKGADLSHAKGLTQRQLDEACGDADTKLP